MTYPAAHIASATAAITAAAITARRPILSSLSISNSFPCAATPGPRAQVSGGRRLLPSPAACPFQEARQPDRPAQMTRHLPCAGRPPREDF